MLGHHGIRAASRYFQILSPILILSAYLLVGEVWVFAILALLPAAAYVSTLPSPPPPARDKGRDGLTGLLNSEGFQIATEMTLTQANRDDQSTACFHIELDDFIDLRARHGQASADTVLRQTAQRISQAMRDIDHVARIGEARFATTLAASPSLDQDACLRLSARLQTALEEPVTLPNATLLPTCSIGFALAPPQQEANAFLDCAAQALEEARRKGTSCIRAHSPELGRRALRHRQIEADAAFALERNEIKAWFQPQLSTDTGRVSGFEALARWDHPKFGVIPPIEFLPLLHRYGLSEALTDRMLTHSLRALRKWDRLGLDIPQVGVNFADEELHNPNLPDKVAWVLDRFDILPERLAIEILESVVTGPKETVVVRNITRLAELGCAIDLDDFGTGQTSIGALRQLPVSRLKIARMFVSQVDRDGDQHRMITAILTMCERLGIETLAEGVETAGEHTMLAQLGCAHVQGFGIAHPMPFAQTLPWLRDHRARLVAPPQIGRKTG